MAVVQDGAATAPRAGKPLCAAAVSVSAVCTDLRWLNCAMVPAVRESPVGSARRSSTVEHHPVDDSVTAVARVVRAVQATPDFCGELSLLIGITGRKVSPCGRRDEACEADGFGIDRREQPGGAERRRLGARRDEDLGAAGPFAVNTDAVLPADPPRGGRRTGTRSAPRRRRRPDRGGPAAAGGVAAHGRYHRARPRQWRAGRCPAARSSSGGGCRHSGGAAVGGSPDRRGVVRRSVGSRAGADGAAPTSPARDAARAARG